MKRADELGDSSDKLLLSFSQAWALYTSMIREGREQQLSAFITWLHHQDVMGSLQAGVIGNMSDKMTQLVDEFFRILPQVSVTLHACQRS